MPTSKAVTDVATGFDTHRVEVDTPRNTMLRGLAAVAY